MIAFYKCSIQPSRLVVWLIRDRVSVCGTGGLRFDLTGHKLLWSADRAACTVNSRYLEVVRTIFYKFKLPEVPNAKLLFEKAIKMYFWFRKTLQTSHYTRYPSSRYQDSTVHLDSGVTVQGHLDLSVFCTNLLQQKVTLVNGISKFVLFVSISYGHWNKYLFCALVFIIQSGVLCDRLFVWFNITIYLF